MQFKKMCFLSCLTHKLNAGRLAHQTCHQEKKLKSVVATKLDPSYMFFGELRPTRGPSAQLSMYAQKEKWFKLFV